MAKKKELKFNNKIYRKEAILETIRAYSDFATFDIKNERAYTKVRIYNIDPSVKKIITEEFSNYVLGVSKKCL